MDYTEMIRTAEDHDEIESIIDYAYEDANVSGQEFIALCEAADIRHDEVTAMENAISEEEKNVQIY